MSDGVIQSINSNIHLLQSPFTGQFFRWRHFALPSMSLIFLRSDESIPMPPLERLIQSCWRNEGSMDRDKERGRGRGLGLDESFFPELTRSWNSTRYFKFRKNSNRSRRVVFQKLPQSLDRVRGLYRPSPPLNRCRW
jgi:hypothetical protein